MLSSQQVFLFLYALESLGWLGLEVRGGFEALVVVLGLVVVKLVQAVLVPWVFRAVIFLAV